MIEHQLYSLIILLRDGCMTKVTLHLNALQLALASTNLVSKTEAMTYFPWLGHKNGSEDFGREVFISDNETVEDYLLKSPI